MNKYAPILLWVCFFITFSYFNKWTYKFGTGHELTFGQSFIMVAMIFIFFISMTSYLDWIGK